MVVTLPCRQLCSDFFSGDQKKVYPFRETTTAEDKSVTHLMGICSLFVFVSPGGFSARLR